MKTNLLETQKAYIAGFLDGDGCILAQIVPNSTYKFNFYIRVSVIFYQKKKRHWFILWLHKILKLGTIRIRKDNISEYTIVGYKPVETILRFLYPFLLIKKPIARLVLKIIDQVKTVKTKEDFLEVCKLVDKISHFTDSKKRKNTSDLVKLRLFHL